MVAKPRHSRGKFRKTRKSRLWLWTTLAIAVLVAAYVFIMVNSRPQVSGERLRFDTFIGLVQEGRVTEARLLDQDAFVVGSYTRGDGAVAQYNTPYLQGSSREGLLEILIDNRVPTTIEQQFSKRVLGPVSLLLPTLIIVVLITSLVLSYRRGSGLFGVRSGARRFDSNSSKVGFDDVAGQDAAVTELSEIKRFLADPAQFSALGVTVPKGILLFGPPGCGKTLLARAVAGEAGAAFYSIAGSDFVEVYVGVGAARMRDLFREARENAPAIVFIDELDSVGRRRKSGTARSGADEEQEQALNQILAELDGFSPLQGIIVIGATNRPDVLDPALLRPGRFDRSIGLERPTEDGRLKILALHARNKSLDASVDLDDIAHRAIGLSGADLASVMNEGGLLAARAGKRSISQLELDEALSRILSAPERQRRLSMRDRSFGRSAGGEERSSFSDVAGIDEIVAELDEVKEYLAEPERFVMMGARPPRGFLLVGPPGCGKTLLARAVATEANAAFFSVASTEFVEAFAGEGAARVRDLFAEAKAAAPSIVFIDEVDAIGARRATSLSGNRDNEQTLNQILIELDGFEARSGVIVMAATNRPEILDEALVRAGRFDRTIVLGLPDRQARRSILTVHAAGKRLGFDVDLDDVAAVTQGFSGADLAGVLNEAALLAARRRLLDISMAVMEEAIDRVGLGIARANRLTDEDREVLAYHEAGHALVGRTLCGGRLPRRISIVARGRALGSAWSNSESERRIHPRSALIDEMAGLLGGVAAEELVFGEPASGSADDLLRVSVLARRMVCELGMSAALGRVVYPSTDSGPEGAVLGYSEEVARTIDAESRLLVDEAFGRARSALVAARPVLDRVARALVERETLTSDEIEELVRREPTRSSRPARARKEVAGAAVER